MPGPAVRVLATKTGTTDTATHIGDRRHLDIIHPNRWGRPP